MKQLLLLAAMAALCAAASSARASITVPDGAPYRIVTEEEADAIEVFAINSSDSKFMVNYQLTHVAGGTAEWPSSGGKRCYPGDKSLLFAIYKNKPDSAVSFDLSTSWGDIPVESPLDIAWAITVRETRNLLHHGGLMSIVLAVAGLVVLWIIGGNLLAIFQPGRRHSIAPPRSWRPNYGAASYQPAAPAQPLLFARKEVIIYREGGRRITTSVVTTDPRAIAAVLRTADDGNPIDPDLPPHP